MHSTVTGLPLLQVAFDPSVEPGVSVGLPVLGGQLVERIFPMAEPAGRAGPFSLFRAEDWLLGVGAVPTEGIIELASRELYTSLFAVTRGLRLARIWNYVPAINAPAPGGLERYRAFSHGRSLAFEAEFGPGFPRAVPAASAVGTDAAKLLVLFAATSRQPRHVENPLQVPAYHYPPEHGPRPPSFARATVVSGIGGRSDVFISGTAAIRGHATAAPGATPPQLACTLENLREISAACGLGPDLARGCAAARHFKVYLRHETDLATVTAVLERELFLPTDCVSYLRSDICRRELNVEIEATLMGVATE